MSKQAPIEKVVSSWAEFQDVLHSLGNPAEGTSRVYRGQPRTYRAETSGPISLLPALNRPGSSQEYDPLWFSRIFTTLMKGKIPPDLWLHQLWAPALLQHYGPGSSFLDVTSNLGIALWFAAHDRLERWTMVLASPDGKQFAPHYYRTCWYTHCNEKLSPHDGPVLLVFDVRPWNGKEGIRHGSLVSLQSSPWGDTILKSATRLKAQEAHLVYSDIKSSPGSELNNLLTAIIYLDGISNWLSADYDLPVGKIFPSPEDDPFYRSLLDTPSRVSFPPRYPERAHLEHPLSIPCYLVNDPPLWEDPSVFVKTGSGDRLSPAEIGLTAGAKAAPLALKELHKYVELSSQLYPVLFYPYLLKNLSFAQPNGGIFFAGIFWEFDKATVFLLECPLWDVTPPLAKLGHQGHWIESALVHGIPDIVGGRLTDSIYLEASNLESWTLEDRLPDHIRGVWIVRQHPYYAVTAYFISGGRPAAVTHNFKYSAGEGRFVWEDTRSDAAKTSHRLTQPGLEFIRQIALKALFIGLTLLRDFSPQLKPPPYHGLKIGNTFLPAEYLETKCADVIEEGPFLVPKSLNGAAYVHTLGRPDVKPNGSKEVQAWVDSLKPYLKSIRDPYYLSMAGRTLAEIYLEAGQRKMASQYIDWALAIAAGVQWPKDIELVFKELKKRIGAAS